MLRNTSWVSGVAVYTGHESKLMKNSTRAPLKRSTVDKITNTQVLMLFFLLVLLCFISSLFNELWTRQHKTACLTYLGLGGKYLHKYIFCIFKMLISLYFWVAFFLNFADYHGMNFGSNLLTFVILFNNLIPISLQVTLEVVRFIQVSEERNSIWFIVKLFFKDLALIDCKKF